MPARLYALVWGYVCSEEGVPSLICTKVPYGLSGPKVKDLKLYISLCFVLLGCSGGITSTWLELYSQGVYHGLSAKKMGSCLQGGAQGTGEDRLRDTLTIVKCSLLCVSPHHFRTCIGHVPFSPLLDQGGDRQAAGVCSSGTQENQDYFCQPL